MLMTTMEANWSSESNWTIASGSIPNCLTFQSSLSFIDDDDEEPSTATKSTPLLLLPPSPDSPPCEIKINFAGKHELRQVYVRSTARLYEIYCAPDLKSNADYLCTVRCGVAVRDGDVLRCSPGNRESGDESVKSEDDWVDVKVADTCDLDGRNKPFQTKPCINSTDAAAQDLFEATAEIDDVDPCVSVTIRLLSLQNKGCVNVDEIYVFADPVDSDSQESLNENSSGSSLMAMFLPTLMQLSKAKTGLRDLNADRKDKQLVSEDGLEEKPCSSDSVIKTQLKGKAIMSDPLEVKLKEVKEGSSHLDIHSQVANMESDRADVPIQAAKEDSNCTAVHSKIAEIENSHSAVPSQAAIADSNQGGFSGGGVERVLEQLVSRMDRLEQICLGFQEKMVMPMNSIEARLQRVEQQLDTLTKKSQSSASSSSCYRISASDASSTESDASSTESDDISCEICLDDTAIREIESDNNYLHTEIPCVSPHDLSDLEYAPQIIPGLVVTAPEFCDEEDEVDNASGPEMNSPNDKGKQSIDDALSSALANLLSSSLSLESPKNIDTLPHKAPEILNEDDDNHGSDEDILKNDSVHLTDSKTEMPSSNISLGGGVKVNRDSNDTHSEKVVWEAEEYYRFYSTEGDQDEACVKASILAGHDLRTGFSDDIEEDKNGKNYGKESDGLSSNVNISTELLDNQTPSCLNITQEGPSARTELTCATEVQGKTFHENIIENVLGFSLASNALDFEIPLLDVKFISQRNSMTEGFLEALLVETQETSSRDPSVQESNGDILKSNGNLSVEEQCNLISVDGGEPGNPASDDYFALDEALCTSIASPVNIGVDYLQGDHKRKRDVGEISPSSLI